MTLEKAEILAIDALGWLAGEPDDLNRFLDLSGLGVDDLRAATGTPEMSVAILDFLLANEALLLRFCDFADASPKDLHFARHLLGGI